MSYYFAVRFGPHSVVSYPLELDFIKQRLALMLEVKLLEDESIVVLQPHGELSERDFRSAAERIDPAEGVRGARVCCGCCSPPGSGGR